MSVLETFAGALGGVANGNPLAGAEKGAVDSVTGFGLGQIGSWVLDGTESALREVASVIGAATAPNLESTWFSGVYWRVAGIAALLTLPFLFAAAVQALARSDLMLLAKAVFGYLPLSLIGVSLAAPVTMLLLAATDQMCVVVSATGVAGGAGFLDRAAAAAGAMSALSGSTFYTVIVGMLALMAALAVAIELLIRAAAVYVVVLMLPLAFAAMVWPARRIWATRTVELLAALILSKFVIVAVLSLAGAGLAGSSTGIAQLLTAMALLMLSAFAPWALVRILPFTELAAGAAGVLRNELPHAHVGPAMAARLSERASDYAMALPARMRDQAGLIAAGRAGAQTQDGTGAPDSAATADGAGAAAGLGPIDDAAVTDGTAAAGAPAPAAGAPEPAADAAQQVPAADQPDHAERSAWAMPDPWPAGARLRLDDRLLGAAQPPGKSAPLPDSPPPPSSGEDPR